MVASTGNPAHATATARAVLDRGNYLVIPTSIGCISNGVAEEEGRSFLRDRAESSSAIVGSGDCRERRASERGEDEGGFSAAVETALGRMFSSLDADCDGVLSREEVGAKGQLAIWEEITRGRLGA